MILHCSLPKLVCPECQSLPSVWCSSLQVLWFPSRSLSTILFNLIDIIKFPNFSTHKWSFLSPLWCPKMMPCRLGRNTTINICITPRTSFLETLSPHLSLLTSWLPFDLFVPVSLLIRLLKIDHLLYFYVVTIVLPYLDQSQHFFSSRSQTTNTIWRSLMYPSLSLILLISRP